MIDPYDHLTDHELTDDELDEVDRRRADRRNRRVLTVMGAAFIAVLVGIVGVQWVTDTPDTADELPEFTLTTLDGEPFELRSVVGTPTVVNFFATWCIPCRDELPAFEAVNQDVAGSVTFLGINSRETDPAEVTNLLDATGVTYPVVIGDDGTLITEVGGLAMPTTVFVDADGTIAEVHSLILTEDALRDKLDEHFGVAAASPAG